MNKIVPEEKVEGFGLEPEPEKSVEPEAPKEVRPVFGRSARRYRRGV